MDVIVGSIFSYRKWPVAPVLVNREVDELVEHFLGQNDIFDK